MTLKTIYPWGDFEIDDATGLPTVPEEGMFWRVAKTSSIHWEVQLRKYRRFRFSEILERATYNSETPINEDWVLDGAAYALKRYSERDTRKSNTSLLGNYPPKSL